MIYAAYFAALMVLMFFGVSIHHANNDNFVGLANSRTQIVLWFIAAAICFK